MSRLDGELGRLMDALTAQERAVLVLRSFKEDRPEDPLWRRGMPTDQVLEFNAYIDLMNGANRELGSLVMVLYHLVGKLETQFGWLASLTLWRRQAEELAARLAYGGREPVTEGEYRRLREAALADYVPLAELAELLVERHEGWTEADYEGDEEGEAREPRLEAWDRVQAEKERELAALVKGGRLRARKKGRELLVQVGGFHAWLGEPFVLDGYEVLPDTHAAAVERLREERRMVQEALARAPERLLGPPPGRQETRTLIDVLHERVRVDLCQRWQEMRSVETVWEEIAESFGGEDPARPLLRQDMDEVRERLLEISRAPLLWQEPVELPEPSEEDLERTRELVRTAAEFP